MDTGQSREIRFRKGAVNYRVTTTCKVTLTNGQGAFKLNFWLISVLENDFTPFFNFLIGS